MDGMKKMLLDPNSTHGYQHGLDTDTYFDLRKRKCSMILSLNGENRNNSKYVGKRICL